MVKSGNTVVVHTRATGRVISSNDVDIASRALEDVQATEIHVDDATSARLVKVIDRNMMPILCVVYGLNFLDKTTLTYASVMGLTSSRRDGGIELYDEQYNWLASVFYFGYLIGEWPTTRLLQYLPLGKYLAFNIIAWGAILCCFPAATNFAGAMVLRFLLGLLESSITPGFALLTSQWYTKSEQGMRTSLWFSFNGAAQIFGGLVAYGVSRGTKEHRSTIEPWKIIFFVYGLLTIVFGIVFLWIAPDNQTNARWLTKRDRLLCIQRIKVNQQGIGNRRWKRHQAIEAITDPLSWAFVAYSFIAMIPNGGLTGFFSPLIKSFGYTAEQALLYGAPGGAVQIVTLVLSGYLGDRFQNRLLLSSPGLLIAIVGMSLMAFLPEHLKAGKLAGYYLNTAAICPFVAILSLISTNVAGYTKKTTVAAMYLVGYCVGNIIGPQVFRGTSWKPAEFTFIICYALCFLDVLFIRWYCLRLNHKKTALIESEQSMFVNNRQWHDLTDRENPYFRYSV
ncbi:major facilitator superfamily domain-containing protein [Dactylonectria estremocensis]|uniref:Major facilitator superfamily domain-containing protein n=1 Tax=Dactylonectria estremocensis TaxID=1079267 RepID=A0A9P9ETN4_9HYPO|nr:major facilitator superfamily domain-containing protein [Dactylonectria estremocensis]